MRDADRETEAALVTIPLARRSRLAGLTLALAVAAFLLAAPALAATSGEPAARPVRSSVLATLLVAAFLEAAGLAAYAALRRVIPERPGLYAFGKVAGLLAFSYLAWLGASVGVFPFRQTPLLLLAALLFGPLVYALRPELGALFRRREVVLTEVAVWGTFAVVLLFRALTPAISWGEKPMDFSILNALYRTTALPPPEPWFAGAPLRYTYFGHFVVAALGKALAIDPALMFNLGLAVTAAGAAAALLFTGSVVAGRLRGGLFALLLGLFAGNLTGLFELVRRRTLDFDLFWATSRVIEGTIDEYPLWSLLFGDLHAHVLVWPWGVAFVGAALLLVERVGLSNGADAADGAPRTGRRRTAALAGLAALLLGAAVTTNGWSAYSLPVVFVGLVLVHRPWARETASAAPAGGWRRLRALAPWAPFLAVPLGAALAFAPFLRSFRAPRLAFGVERWAFAAPKETLLVFGLFVALLAPFALLAAVRALLGPEAPTRRRRAALGAALLVLFASAISWPALVQGRLAPAGSVRVPALLLGVAAAVAAAHWTTRPTARPALALAAAGFLLVAACDTFFVGDRMNTVFKYHLDAWLLFALAGGAALSSFLERPRTVATRAWRLALSGAAALAFVTSAAATVGALRTPRAAGPRGTLDGLLYLAKSAPDEYAVVQWLNRNVSGTPVVAEAVGPAYREFGRVSMRTGLPTVVGWERHLLQRGYEKAEVRARVADVESLYRQTSAEAAAEILARHQVEYVFSGAVETARYGGVHVTTLPSWPEVIEPAYRHGSTVVFRVSRTLVQAARSGVDVRALVSGRLAGVARSLGDPRGLAVDRDGTVFVADVGNRRVALFGPTLKLRASLGERGAGPDVLAEPVDVAVDEAGLVYVADPAGGRVALFGLDGTPRGERREGLTRPEGLALDASGALFVADAGASRVVRFSKSGKREGEIGLPGSGPGALDSPSDVAVDAQRRLWVADAGNRRIQLFDPSGRAFRALPVPDWSASGHPRLSAARDGTVWYSVPGRAEIRSFRRDLSSGPSLPVAAAPGGRVFPAAAVAAHPNGVALAVVTTDGRLAWMRLARELEK